MPDRDDAELTHRLSGVLARIVERRSQRHPTSGFAWNDDDPDVHALRSALVDAGWAADAATTTRDDILGLTRSLLRPPLGHRPPRRGLLTEIVTVCLRRPDDDERWTVFREVREAEHQRHASLQRQAGVLLLVLPWRRRRLQREMLRAGQRVNRARRRLGDLWSPQEP